MSHLNAVTVLVAAFAAREFELQGRRRIRLIRTYRNASAPFPKIDGRPVRQSTAFCNFRPRDATGQRCQIVSEIAKSDAKEQVMS
jgi:hypothetical protein